MQERKNNFRIVEGMKTNNPIKNAYYSLKNVVDRGVSAVKSFMEQQSDENKRKRTIMIVGGIIAVAGIVSLVFFQTFHSAKISTTYEVINASESKYEEFQDGLLKYGRDGVSFVTKKGEEQWNQSYQVKTPCLVVNGEVAAIADIGGNSIGVYEKNGVKGEIETSLTIEKIAISKQGIVATILSNNTTPLIVCYDATGNRLIEHKTSLTGTGYPIDISLSDDGTVLQVLYNKVEDGKLQSKIVYYNFESEKEDSSDRKVFEKVVNDSIFVDGFFFGNDASVAVGEQELCFFSGKSKPKEKKTITVEGTIQSVCQTGEYLGVFYKTKNGKSYTLKVYDDSGNERLSAAVEKNYKKMKISNRKVILYEGKQCAIYTMYGQKRFEGEMPEAILEIIPKRGLNSYYVVDQNGIEVEQLTK